MYRLFFADDAPCGMNVSDRERSAILAQLHDAPKTLFNDAFKTICSGLVTNVLEAPTGILLHDQLSEAIRRLLALPCPLVLSRARDALDIP